MFLPSGTRKNNKTASGVIAHADGGDVSARMQAAMNEMSNKMMALNEKIAKAERTRSLGRVNEEEERELETTLANMAAMLATSEARLDERENAALESAAMKAAARLANVEARISADEAERRKREVDDLEQAKRDVYEARKSGMQASFEVAQEELQKRARILDEAEKTDSYIQAHTLFSEP